MDWMGTYNDDMRIGDEDILGLSWGIALPKTS